MRVTDEGTVSGSTQFHGTVSPFDEEGVTIEGASPSGVTPEASVEGIPDTKGEEGDALGDLLEQARDLGPGTERLSIEVD